MWNNDDNRFSERDAQDELDREESERLDAMQVEADALDAARDAFYAGQEALEQVWLGEVYAAQDGASC